MELTKNMTDIIQDIVDKTPDEIQNMSVDEIKKHAMIQRKKNRMFYKICKKPIFARRKKQTYTEILPRGSMIAAHHRFTLREETNKKIRKMK